jgi:hypothetical protein
MRRLLMRVFSIGLRSSFLPWAVEGAQEQVDRDTSVSKTPTVAPGSLAHERALLRERRARGPHKLLGPPTARVNAQSEDHVKMQRLRMRGATIAREIKRRATHQSPRRQPS